MKPEYPRTMDLWLCRIRWPDDSYIKERNVGSVYDVCLFDANSHTYVAELTPSYALHYLYTDIEPVGPITEAIRDKYTEAGLDTPEVDYMHARTIDAALGRSPDDFYHIGTFHVSDTDEEEDVIADNKERFRGNYML